MPFLSPGDATNMPELQQVFQLWREAKIGRPPQRKELVVALTKITKATLSFKINIDKGYGSRLDPLQGIVINGQSIFKMNSQPVETYGTVFKGYDIEITNLLRTDPRGEKNVIEVNYLLSQAAKLMMQVPGKTIGTLSVEVKVFYSVSYCPNCGSRIPEGKRFCPECLDAGFVIVCPNCKSELSEGAESCDKCGAGPFTQ